MNEGSKESETFATASTIYLIGVIIINGRGKDVDCRACLNFSLTISLFSV